MASAKLAIRRSLAALGVLAIAGLGGGLALLGTSHSAGATSSIGGTISRTEIAQRAQYWIDRGVMYSQSNYTYDLGHTKNYRQDCSGFVTMAWHASGDHYTGNMLAISHTISYSQLQPGDAFLAPSHHTALFEGWTSSSHNTAIVWEESTWGKPALKTTWSRSYYSGYYAVRYNHVSGSSGGGGGGGGGSSTATWPTVQSGAHGVRVQTIQYLLAARGYHLSADGDFGPLTRSAVRSFQSARHLAVDGVVGPQTWGSLIVTVRSGSHGSAVKALQRELNAHGAHLVVDGDFGPATRAAVRSYQSTHHLAVDGVVGPQTWSSLVR